MADQTDNPYDQVMPDVKPDWRERAARVFGASSGEDNSLLMQAIQQHHQQRLQEAQMHHQAAVTYGGALWKANHGVDPDTGNPITGPEQQAAIDKYQHLHDMSYEAYAKAAGVNKDAKSMLEKAKGITQYIIHGPGGQKQQQQGQPQPTTYGATPAPQVNQPSDYSMSVMDQGVSATPPSTAVTAASTPSDTGTTAPPPATSPEGTTTSSGGFPISGAGGPRMTPPPTIAGSQEPSSPQAAAPLSKAAAAKQLRDQEMQSYFLRNQMQFNQNLNRSLQVETAKYGAEVGQRKAVADQLFPDKTSREYKDYVATGKVPAASFLQKTNMVDDDGKPVSFDKESNKYVNNDGEVIENPKPRPKQMAGDGKLEIVAGIPTGRVMHDGKFVAPGEKGFEDSDKAAVDRGMAAQGLSQKQKEQLAYIRGAAFAKERARWNNVGTVDNDTGQAAFVSQLEIAKNPGKYLPPGEAEKISARERVHGSLRTNFDALDKDLDKLKGGLDTGTQAVVAAAMRSENPGMLDNLLVNKVKENASPETIQYITDMKTLQEDILVLRNVGGMGQGSDMMRGAMMRLIPGPGTSSVMEAKMQLKAAQRTSESLFAGAPKARFSTPPSANAPAAAPTATGGFKKF